MAHGPTERGSGAGSVRGDADFGRLWAGLAVSQVGSAVGMVALPVVAVVVLHASTAQVAVLAGVTSVTVALLAFPLGAAVEHRRKRPVLVAADVLRFGSLGSVPLAGSLGVLTLGQLYLVGVVNAAGQVAFQAASQAQLKALVGAERIIDANGRLESTQWLSLTVGPSVGGLLIGVLGALAGTLVDAVSFLASAVAVGRLRRPEPAPPAPPVGASRRSEPLGGLAFAVRHPGLRWVLLSWLAFAGAVALSAPVSVVYYLRVLHFEAWQYGLLLGLPSLGGFLGARAARHLAGRYGPLHTLRMLSFLRGPWQLLIPLARPGALGLVLCLVGTFGVLLFSGAHNSTMAGYRALQTPDHLMSRVSTLWSFTTTVSQPLFILAGGILATLLSPRAALLVGAALMTGSAFLLLPARS